MDSSARILVVDDVPQNVRLLEDILTAKGYEVVTATTGDEAIAAVDSMPLSLVLLDVVMPGKNGFEVCREIRANPEQAMLPVVLVTALDSTEDRVKGIEAGADDFLTKPVDMHELLARVRSLLRIRELFDTVQRQTTELQAWNETLAERVEAQVTELERLNRLRRFLSPQIAELVVTSGREDQLDSHRREIATGRLFDTHGDGVRSPVHVGVDACRDGAEDHGGDDEDDHHQFRKLVEQNAPGANPAAFDQVVGTILLQASPGLGRGQAIFRISSQLFKGFLGA